MRPRDRRPGAVLLLVLVLIPLLAMGAYAFTHWMRAEARGAMTAQRQAQARWLARSGIELVRALLADPQTLDPAYLDLTDNPNLLADQIVGFDPNGMEGVFSALAPVTGGTANQFRFGIESECAKIPLHNGELRLTRDALMNFPSMTQEIADAILDWLDADDTPGESGAESEYYLSLDPPYKPRNGIPATVEELLLVKGVTPTLFFGEDANRNGYLDPNENDGDAQWPPDNSDGLLDPGWYRFFSLHSAAGNQTVEGEPKLNLNGDATEVQEKLTTLFDAELAAFVAAYRAKNQEIKSISQLINASVEIEQPSPAGMGGGGATVSDDDLPENGGPGVGTGGAPGGGGGEPSRQTIRLESPWKSDNLGTFLDTALKELAVDDKTSAPGRIDVNQAPAEVLAMLPGVTIDTARQIADAALQRSNEDVTPAWILLDGHVELEAFRQIENLITVTPRVYRVDCVGYFRKNGQAMGPYARVEAIVDASSAIPEFIQVRELTPLGLGDTPSWLGAGSVGTTASR